MLLILFLVVLGLCCCVQPFSDWGELGLLFIFVYRLLAVVASLVAEHRLQAHRLNSQSVWAQCWGLWALARTGFSSCGLWARQLQLTGSRALAQQLWHTGLAAPRYVESFWTRDQTHVLCIGREIQIHYTTRALFFFFFFFSF